MLHKISNEGINKVITVDLPKAYKGSSQLMVVLSPKIFTRKRLGKEYVTSSSVECLDGITIDVDDITKFFRMVSGLAPKKEAHQLAWKFNRECHKSIIEFLSVTKLIKELRSVKPRALPKNIFVEYIARDGYRLTVELIEGAIYVVEYDNGTSSRFSCPSKEFALKMAAEQVEMISRMDNIRFTYQVY